MAHTVRRAAIAILFLLSGLSNGQSITDYARCSGTVQHDGKTYVALRHFAQLGNERLLVVDPTTLRTTVIPFIAKEFSPETMTAVLRQSPSTAYAKAIAQAENSSYALQDAGIVHGLSAEQGIVLTIDLCPSHKPFDRSIINGLLSVFETNERPVPIALSITGLFLEKHRDDIDWIDGLQKRGAISVTWINHTTHHRYGPKIPIARNFLLEPGTSISDEILGVEKMLLEMGQMPSVFFRFPGLVSNHELVDQVTGFGLIPVGSDAWLAKGQHAQSGSIVLIHGNGNEPLGIADFLELLRDEKQSAAKREWQLYDLRESVDGEFRP